MIATPLMSTGREKRKNENVQMVADSDVELCVLLPSSGQGVVWTSYDSDSEGYRVH
jgi:hypothetical protein